MTDSRPPIKYVIWSEEHHAWWSPNERGYTTSLYDAGRYDKDVADRIVERANRYVSTGPVNEVAMEDPL